MEASIVGKIAKIAKDNKLNLEITFDNQEILNTAIEGTIVSFNDSKQIVSWMRISDNPVQMFKGPFELKCSEYDRIQAMSIQADYSNMVKVLKDMSGIVMADEEAKMKEFIQTSTANNTYHATPSTENVTDRVGSKPVLYRTDEYGSANESRKKVEPKKMHTVKVGADGSISAEELEKIPKPTRPEL